MRMRVRTAYVILGIGACLAMVMVLLIATSPDTHPRTPVPTGGCASVPADELYVQHAYTCTDGTQVLMFADVTARDAYLKVAEGYGVITLSSGDAWVRIRRS